MGVQGIKSPTYQMLQTQGPFASWHKSSCGLFSLRTGLAALAEEPQLLSSAQSLTLAPGAGDLFQAFPRSTVASSGVLCVKCVPNCSASL